MYVVTKKMEIAISHRLDLDYESKCCNIHGHNLIITVTCKSDNLNLDGMVIDFTHVKQLVNELDHKYLNDILQFNPTAENIAKYLCDRIPCCTKVSVQESEGNIATYEI